MDGHLPLLDAVAPVGVPGDELGGGLFAGHTGGALKVHVVGLEDVEAGDPAHYAGLHQLLGQVALLDVVVVQHQDLQELGGHQQEAAVCGHALAGEGPLGGQNFLVSGGLGAGGLGGGDGGAAGRLAASLQGADGRLVQAQGQGIAGGIQPLGHDAVGDGGGVEAIDQLIDRLVVVDGQIQVGGGAGLGVDAGGLVVGLDLHLGVTDGDLHLAGLGVALVPAVENEVVTGDKGVAQLLVHQTGPALLIRVCHV